MCCLQYLYPSNYGIIESQSVEPTIWVPKTAYLVFVLYCVCANKIHKDYNLLYLHLSDLLFFAAHSTVSGQSFCLNLKQGRCFLPPSVRFLCFVNPSYTLLICWLFNFSTSFLLYDSYSAWLTAAVLDRLDSVHVSYARAAIGSYTTAAQLWSQLSSQEFCSTSNNELMWIWLVALALEKNKSVLINRHIQTDTGTFRAKMVERLLAGTAALELICGQQAQSDWHEEGPQWQGIPQFFSNRAVIDRDIQMLLNGVW